MLFALKYQIFSKTNTARRSGPALPGTVGKSNNTNTFLHLLIRRSGALTRLTTSVFRANKQNGYYIIHVDKLIHKTL